MSDRYWTAAEDAIVARCYSTRGAKGVARELPQCRSEGAIRKRANKLGLSVAHPDRKQYPLRWVNGQRAELARLAGLGMTSAAIAAALGVTKNSIIGALYRHNIQWPRRGLTGPMGSVRIAEIPAKPSICNTVSELPQGGCCWLDGEPREFHYCGKPIARQPNSGHGESYCAEHRAMVWIPPSPSKGRQPDFPGRAKW